MAVINITQSNPEQRNLFMCPHIVHAVLPNDVHLLTLTGVVKLPNGPGDNQGTGYKGITSEAWRRDTLHLTLDLHTDLKGKWFHIEYWAPFVTISSIYNQEEADYAGWAVDDFGLVNWPENKVKDQVEIWANVGVRDEDGYLYRIAYNVMLTGKLCPPPPGP